MARKRNRSRRINKIETPANDIEPKERLSDATPERLAKGDASEFINPAEIDSKEQKISRARRFFKVRTLDRWHRAEVITQRQWWAGDAYRKLHDRAQSVPRVVAAYGERTTGGETDYGMARTAAQARARQAWRDARSAIPQSMIGYLDRLIIRDDLPRYAGRQQARALTDCRNALDALASFLERGAKDLDARGTFV